MNKPEIDAYLLDHAGEVLAGRYRVRDLLGVGAMGSVWNAEHIALRTPVVVKFHEAFRPRGSDVGLRRFLREIELLASVRHRNVAELYESGTTGRGDPYLIMEKLEGEPLADAMQDGEPFSVEPALDIAIDVAMGLEAVHQTGVLHRDVKPENIFLHRSDGGQVLAKLLDFGLAVGESSERLTELGRHTGTPGYMAPEQVLGDQELDPRVDQYALGVCLYEMLAGALPIGGETPMELLVSTVTDDPLPLACLRPDVPREVWEPVMRAIEPVREDRFPSVRMMRRALVAARDHIGSEPAPGVPASTVCTVRRPRDIKESEPPR